MDLSFEKCWPLFIRNVADFALLLLDANGCVVDWNLGAEQFFGYAKQEIINQPASILFIPEDRALGAPEQELSVATNEGRAEDERWHLRKDGSRFRASGILMAIQDSGQIACFAKIMRDVTGREQARERLEESLRERTVLLSEIHHRVKNNLQMIVSLMNLQADRLNNPEALRAFEEMQNRVRAIAHIHERLYSTQDFAAIHFGDYLSNLVYELQALYHVSDQVQVVVSAADLALDIDKAIPLGLISSELVCNAFKHAFPDDRRGVIDVNLSYDAQAPGLGAYLQVTDNGIGLPDSFNFATADSMGFYLIRLLGKQLKAKISMEKTDGLAIRISFPLDNDL